MNRRNILIIFIGFLIILAFFAIYSIDKMKCKNSENPVFTFLTINYKDGGTQLKIGLGYSVIIWNKLSEVSLNNTIISGYNIGNEFVKFPLCYLNIFNHNINPNIELKFIPNENYKELYETNNNEIYNVKIIRYENHGLMNIIPCNVYIYNENMELLYYDNVSIFFLGNKIKENRYFNEYYKLLGGETLFLNMINGNYFIKIITPKEDQMKYLEKYDRNWESIIYNFKISSNEYKELKIMPDYENGIWIIE